MAKICIGKCINPETYELDVDFFQQADYTRSYTRNLVDKGNGKSNLVRYS